MKDFYEEFFIQGSIRIPAPFPPPWDWTIIHGDLKLIMGVYIQDSSTEMMIASAQGIKARGRFVSAPDSPVTSGVTVRRVSDNHFFRIIGDPKQSVKKARSQVKMFEAEITDRGA